MPSFKAGLQGSAWPVSMCPVTLHITHCSPSHLTSSSFSWSPHIWSHLRTLTLAVSSAWNIPTIPKLLQLLTYPCILQIFLFSCLISEVSPDRIHNEKPPLPCAQTCFISWSTTYYHMMYHLFTCLFTLFSLIEFKLHKGRDLLFSSLTYLQCIKEYHMWHLIASLYIC